MALTSSVTLGIRATLTTPADLVTSTAPLNVNYSKTLASGILADQSDMVFSDTRTLAASATEDLDLAGALLMVNGAAFTPAKLKMIYVKAASTNVNDVVVSRSAANGVPFLGAAGDAHSVKPGGVMLLFSPTVGGLATVTAGTGDLITITNSGAGTSVSYDIVMEGASA
jgi:hypothetical protein